MAKTESIMLPLGTLFPSFVLKEVGGQIIDSGIFKTKPALVMFICFGHVRFATKEMLAGNPPPPSQKPSLGCNIKWKTL